MGPAGAGADAALGDDAGARPAAEGAAAFGEGRRRLAGSTAMLTESASAAAISVHSDAFDASGARVFREPASSSTTEAWYPEALALDAPRARWIVTCRGAPWPSTTNGS